MGYSTGGGCMTKDEKAVSQNTWFGNPGLVRHSGIVRLELASGFVALLSMAAFSQGPKESVQDRFRRMSVDAEKKGLAEPFRGITANGSVQPGLFGIRSTGV